MGTGLAIELLIALNCCYAFSTASGILRERYRVESFFCMFASLFNVAVTIKVLIQAYQT